MNSLIGGWKVRMLWKWGLILCFLSIFLAISWKFRYFANKKTMAKYGLETEQTTHLKGMSFGESSDSAGPNFYDFCFILRPERYAHISRNGMNVYLHSFWKMSHWEQRIWRGIWSIRNVIQGSLNACIIALLSLMGRLMKVLIIVTIG